MSDLIPIENLKASEIFNNEEADKIIAQITDRVGEFSTDISTAKGRKELSTLAAKIAKSKVLIDDLGKNLVAGWKTQAKEVDVVRKKIRDSLDELKLKTRAPLTQWEDNEKARIKKHEDAIEKIKVTGMQARDNWHEADLSVMKNCLTVLKETETGEDWEEYQHDATVAKFEAIAMLEDAIERREAQDAKDAELEKYRKEAEAADRKRYEESERMAAEKAAREATIEENTRLKREADEAKAQVEEAKEQARKETEERHARERAIAEEEAAAREADTKHRGKVNREAAKALATVGLSADDAKTAIKAIASRMIPNVTINY